MSFLLTQKFRIESARFLPNLPINHPCRNTHGHSFLITLFLKGDLDKNLGWLKDFNDVKKIVEPILKTIDHKILNDIEGLSNPTTEILCKWFFDKTKPHLPELVQVSVSETPDTEIKYPFGL